MVAICRASKYSNNESGNATATQFDSSDFVRRPEEYERNFNCSNYEKFEESYAQEINLIGCLD